MRNMIFGLAMVGSFSAVAQSKPNIILLMADDLGWADTGFNGNKIIKTPNLDKMAKEGVRFNRFYSASAECSPTRASVLTGRNPFRIGVYEANSGILRPEEITLPELLKGEGYTTGLFGKWHLGTLTHKEKDANRGKPGNLKEFNPPIMHGYDCAFVTESKVPTYDPMKKPRDRFDKEGWDYLKENEPFEPFGTAYWDINGNKVTDNLDGDDSRVIMDRAIPFVEQAIMNSTPFLAVIWFHSPHMPCVAGPKYQEMYKGQDSKMRNYAGSITALDEQVGRLREILKDRGVDSNTMIWFCSDNGPEDGSPGSAGIFRERKHSLHEGGVRVPGLLVWPQKITHPYVTDMPCVTSDYLPTIMEVLKIKKSKVSNQLDGISLLPLLEGRMSARPKPIGFCFPGQVSYCNNQYKLYAQDGVYELYDILKDPEEKNDIQLEKSYIFKHFKKNINQFVLSCKLSFEGKENEKASYERLNQKWIDPTLPKPRQIKTSE